MIFIINLKEYVLNKMGVGKSRLIGTEKSCQYESNRETIYSLDDLTNEERSVIENIAKLSDKEICDI